jgi:hypothetical protein
VAIANSKTEQIKKIQGLLSTATISRQRQMYEKMLTTLIAQQKKEEEVESKSQAVVKSKAAAQAKSQLAINNKAKQATSSKKKRQEGFSSVDSANQALQRSPKSTKDLDKPNESVATKTNKIDAKVDSKKIEPIEPVEEKLVEKSVEPELRFQAKGVLEGEISLVEKGLAIAIDGEQYPLRYTFISRDRDYRKLQEELSSGSVTSVRKRVSVYPQVKYVDKKYCYFFNLVSVQKEGKRGIFSELEPGEFYLSGVWQYVHSYPTPCLSVYRNITDNFLQMISKWSLEKVRKYLKTIQIPVEGLDSEKAFIYNSQVEKNQQKRREFYLLKVIFSDSKFVVIKDMISVHSKIPKYLTASRATEFLKKVSGKN